MEILITPTMAAEWIDKYKYHRQRAINRGTVDAYAAAMAAGLWRKGDGLIILGRCQSNTYLLAGNHRLHAVVKAGVPICFNVTERDYRNEDEVVADYAVTNGGIKMTMRQSVEIMGAREAIGVPDMTIKGAISSLRFIGQHMDANSTVPPILKNPATIDKLIRAWEVPIYAYWRSTQGAPPGQRSWYISASVMSVGLITFRYKPDVAEKFWFELANADGLRKGTPLFNLHNKLATHKTLGRTDRANLVNYVARAWNAYYKGEDSHVLQKYRGAIYGIHGTPASIGGQWDALSMLGVK